MSKGKKRAAGLLVLVCTIIFIDSLGYGIVVPVMPVYARSLGVTQVGLGLLFASYALGNIAGALPFGILSDRLGRRHFLTFGMMAMAGAFIIYAYSTTFLELFLSRFLDGLTAAANWSVGLAIVADAFPAGERGERMGMVMTAMGAGSIAGPLLGGVFYDWLGYKAPFLFVAGLCVLGGLAAISSRGLKCLVASAREESYLEMTRMVLRHPVLAVTLMIVMMGTINLGVLEPLFPVYLKENMGLSSTTIGLLFALTIFTFTVFSPLVGLWVDRRGKRAPMIWGLLATAFVVPALTFSKNLTEATILFSLCGFSITLFETPTMPLIADAIGSEGEGEVYGTAFGLFNMAWALGYILGPLAGGFLAQKHGLSTAVIMLSVPLVILAWKLREKLPKG